MFIFCDYDLVTLTERLKQEEEKLRREARERTTGYLNAALGLVAGLAWNNAVTALIEAVYPAQNSVLAKFIYAAVVTLVVVILSTYIIRQPKS